MIAFFNHVMEFGQTLMILILAVVALLQGGIIHRQLIATKRLEEAIRRARLDRADRAS